MDAICFVLGLSARHLRGNQLQDLIHRPESRGGSSARPKKAFVSLIFVVGDEAIGDMEPRSEVEFSRHILRGGQSQYRLNGRDLTWSEYDATLARIGVLTRARNFLVFQVCCCSLERIWSFICSVVRSHGRLYRCPHILAG